MRARNELFRKQWQVGARQNTASVKCRQVTVTHIQVISMTVSQNLELFALRV